MPRRTKPDPLARRVGSRIRELREAADLTMEQLAYSSDLSKGHLSSIEQGRVRPTIQTLNALASGLDVHLLDLVTFPDQDHRQALVDATRGLAVTELRRLLKSIGR